MMQCAISCKCCAAKQKTLATLHQHRTNQFLKTKCLQFSNSDLYEYLLDFDWMDKNDLKGSTVRDTVRVASSLFTQNQEKDQLTVRTHPLSKGPKVPPVYSPFLGRFFETAPGSGS